jgi:predicted nucleotidyltransferase
MAGRRGRKLSEMRREAKEPWTLEEALPLIRKLAPALVSVGFSIGPGGSVLIEGESKNDLDFIIYPLDASSYNMNAVRRVLERHELRQLWARHEIAAFWARTNSNDNKHVEVWGWQKHRIDIFFMR